MNIMQVIIIAISLGVDAFSIAICFGMFNIPFKKGVFFASVVGTLHFIMPLFANNISLWVNKYLFISSDKILGLVFIVLIIKMIYDIFQKEESNYRFNYFELIIYAISVSLDSFTMGLGLRNITSNIYIASLIFSIVSFTLCILGKKLGSISYNSFGKAAKIIGLIVMIIIATIHIV